MKVKTFKLVTQKVNEVRDCTRFIAVPGWVWPFNCDNCGWEIEKDEPQIIAEVGEDIQHFHERCWTEVTSH